MKKNQHVYDNIKHKTPMRKMLEEQEARRKALEEAEKKATKTSTRKAKED